ncbi:type II toxin-antitoxin system VapC family toxin [Rhodococcus ruber]|uniref:type II toxin-antitoxin system VapC family toxin n=1 Tax=Rhodococcus ruber TaxID=1830 RepID=UPI001376BDD7|nr:PIN domain-containing protein [Rhodococcus ruber]
MVDTCVVLDFLIGIDADASARARSLLEGHEQRHLVVLPAIVVPEIAGCPAIRGDDGGKEARAARVALAHEWITGSRFLVAELSERLARRASNLATVYNLRGPDATVLATAIEWSCGVVYTRDRGLLKCSSDSLLVKEPPETPKLELRLLDSTGEPTAEARARRDIRAVGD